MKITSKIETLQATFAKVMTVGLLAGAVVLAAPAKAQAQVVFGIHVGRPVYQQPAYGYYEQGYGYNNRYYDHEARERYYAQERHEAEERQEAYARHEDHERREAYEHRGWNRRDDDR